MTAKQLEGLVAVVTGAGSGIGAATARRFLLEGAQVVSLDRQFGQDFEQSQVMLPLICDVSSAEDVQRAADRVAKELGRCDVLVNCAGVAPVGDAVTCSEAEWILVFDVNAKGTWLMCRAFLPQMVATRSGAIVNVASGAALRPTEGMAAYSSSKAAVVALTRSIALDFAKYGVRANVLCPGPVDTPLHASTLKRRHVNGLLASYSGTGSAATVATSDEMAEYILLLAQPGSRSLTGSALAVDGGRVMH